jgi:hypothetical protein
MADSFFLWFGMVHFYLSEEQFLDARHVGMLILLPFRFVGTFKRCTDE